MAGIGFELKKLSTDVDCLRHFGLMDMPELYVPDQCSWELCFFLELCFCVASQVFKTQQRASGMYDHIYSAGIPDCSQVFFLWWSPDLLLISCMKKIMRQYCFVLGIFRAYADCGRHSLRSLSYIFRSRTTGWIPLLWIFGELIITWNAMSYLTAIKDYRGILLAFIAAILVTFLTGWILLMTGIPHC